eukprot:GHVH01009604.1.p1 GENE.GHVH01009604.1~~GHVH01009604.1.p1  ORF type:complete len:563 (-),score=87.05 GHVH01009604.1:79-1767(-)
METGDHVQNSAWKTRTYMVWRKFWWSVKFEKPKVQGGLRALKDSTLTTQKKNIILNKYQSKKKLKLFSAYFLVLLCVMVWLTMSVELKILELSYHCHFFLVTSVHACWSVALIPWWIWRRLARNQIKQVDSEENFLEGLEPPDMESYIQKRGKITIRTKGQATVDYLMGTKFINMDHLRYSFLSLIALISGWTWYISLPRTKLAANTCIYQSSLAFVYIFSVFILKERRTWYKTVSVIICIAGVAVVAYGTDEPVAMTPVNTIIDTETQNEKIIEKIIGIPEAMRSIGDLIYTATSSTEFNQTTIFPEDEEAVRRLKGATEPLISLLGLVSVSDQTFGYLMVVISMLLYSIYEVLYKVYCYPFALTVKVHVDSIERSSTGHPHLNIESCRAIGLMGVASLMMLPFTIVLHVTGIEVFRWPSLYESYLLLEIGLIDMVYNLLIVIAIGLSTPLTVATGLLLSMPASMLIQRYTQNEAVSTFSVIGAALIAVGFILHVGGNRLLFWKSTNEHLTDIDKIDEAEISEEMSDICILDDEELEEVEASDEYVKGIDVTVTKAFDIEW